MKIENSVSVPLMIYFSCGFKNHLVVKKLFKQKKFSAKINKKFQVKVSRVKLMTKLVVKPVCTVVLPQLYTKVYVLHPANW